MNARILCIHENDLTQVCIHKYADLSRNDSWFTSDGGSFREVIRNKVFIDKSLLLENIFQQTAVVSIIVGPHKWGKTVNLDMIEFFAGIQRYPNGDKMPKIHTTAYKYFVKGEVPCFGTVTHLRKPPLISDRKQLIAENLASYAIIRLSFKGIPNFQSEYPEFSSFYYYFISQVREVFRKYNFLLHKLRRIVEEASNNTGPDTKLVEFARRDYDQYKNILYGRLQESEMLESISFLCNILSFYFHENVLILVDDYDDAINQLFYEPNTAYMVNKGRQIHAYLVHFLAFALKGNRFFTRAIVTGTLKISKVMYNLRAEENQIYYVPNDLQPFYGFTEHEVQQLFYLRGVNEKDSEIAKHYYQHRTLSCPKRIYNPRVISKFLRNRQRANYWSGNSTILNKTLTQLFRFYPFKTVIESLLNMNSYRSVEKEFLQKSDWQFEIAELIRYKSSSLIKDNQVNGILSWLYSLGYVMAILPSPQSDIVHISITNDEVRDYISSQMKSFYTELLKGHLQLLINCENSLMGFLENDDESSERFRHDMLTLLENDSMYDIFKKELEQSTGSQMTHLVHSWNCFHAKVAVARSLVRKVLTLLQIDNKLQVEMSQNCRLPNTKAHQIVFLAFHETRAIIIELVGIPSTIDKTLKQVIDYTIVIKDKMAKFDIVKYVAINVPWEGPIELATAVKRLEEIEIFILSNS